MSDIEQAVERAVGRIQAAAETKGLVALAREADVPYTTVHSFSRRGWSHKSLDVIEKLAAAADRLSEQDDGEAAA